MLKGVGRHPKKGKKKGGIEVHTVIYANEGIPCDVKFTSAATHDSFMLAPSTFSKGEIVAMDRAYICYEKFEDIAEIYLKRWQIELLFKQIKQKFPLRYFYGESVNAIQIQIFATLIANLLLTLLQRRLTRTWSFSGLATMVRIVLMYYINLDTFFESPEKDWEIMFQKASDSPPNDSDE